MFVPFANSYGALVGLAVSVVINLWISIGSIIYGKKPKSKPLRFDMCPDFNTTSFNQTSAMKNYLDQLNAPETSSYG
jgi:hypothetical protein